MVLLSVALGIPLHRMGQELTSRDVAEYAAAYNLGLIADHGTAGEADQQPVDMAEVYQRRKARYAQPGSQGNRLRRA